jgi:hypothetical protein
MGARTVITPDAPGSYLDMGSGQIVDQSVVDAWMAANAAAQAADPTATPSEIQSKLSPPVMTQVEVFDEKGRVIRTVAVNPDGTLDTSGS